MQLIERIDKRCDAVEARIDIALIEIIRHIKERHDRK